MHDDLCAHSRAAAEQTPINTVLTASAPAMIMSCVARIRDGAREENSIRGHDGAKERPICVRLCGPWGRFRLHSSRPQSPTQIGGEMHVFRDLSAPSYQVLALGKYQQVYGEVTDRAPRAPLNPRKSPSGQLTTFVVQLGGPAQLAQGGPQLN